MLGVARWRCLHKPMDRFVTLFLAMTMRGRRRGTMASASLRAAQRRGNPALANTVNHFWQLDDARRLY
ncbi:hypothetical protein ACY05_00480 [Sterolibacterium denitrificans]|uniref:Uncharacterized protein n=1 Tax=Sterolibacterium denitrificans TaxID=157592 RepID=A0A656Z9S6_9PROT|nr:hypothetical protein ACY05_00480 [Sterolibacterium denitrificans]